MRLLAFTFGLFVVGCAHAPRAAPASLPAGDFTASLRDAAAGRPMLIELFATWCEVCRDQSPTLSRLAAEHASRLYVAAVNVGERPAEAAPILRRWDPRYPIFFDPELHFADAVGVTQLPSVLLVAADGRVLLRARALDGPALRRIQEVLGLNPVYQTRIVPAPANEQVELPIRFLAGGARGW